MELVVIAQFVEQHIPAVYNGYGAVSLVPSEHLIPELIGSENFLNHNRFLLRLAPRVIQGRLKPLVFLAFLIILIPRTNLEEPESLVHRVGVANFCVSQLYKNTCDIVNAISAFIKFYLTNEFRYVMLNKVGYF